MNKYIYVLFVAMMLCAGTTSYAQTADGQTPAIETGCDSESGAAFGLCNAYCEAMDCDAVEETQASDKACARVFAQFSKITGREIPSCSGLPQQGESCDGSVPYFRFQQGEGSPYGCNNPDDDTMACQSGVWACYNGQG